MKNNYWRIDGLQEIIKEKISTYKPSELQEIPVAIREQSGVLCFHSR